MDLPVVGGDHARIFQVFHSNGVKLPGVEPLDKTGILCGNPRDDLIMVLSF